MKKIVSNKIELGFHCEEKYGEMDKVEIGRNCEKCSTIVVDFTKLTDDEILNYFSNNSGKTCGRISRDQLSLLNRKLPAHQNRFKNYILALSIIILILFTSCNSKKHLSKECELSKINGFEILYTIPIKNDSIVTLEGIIFDNHKEPLIGANISITEIGLEETSDLDGRYNFDIPNTISPQSKINISYTGLNDIEFYKHQVENKAIKVIMDDEFHLGEIIVKVPLHKKMWYKIRNLFRK